MSLRQVIKEAYHNAVEDDPVTKQDIDGWTPYVFATDLWFKCGAVNDGGWSVEEIAEEIEKMRKEKLIG